MYTTNLPKPSNLFYVPSYVRVGITQPPYRTRSTHVLRLSRPIQLSKKVFGQWHANDNVKLTVVEEHLKNSPKIDLATYHKVSSANFVVL